MDILERLEDSPLGAAVRRLTCGLRPEPEPPDDQGLLSTCPAASEDAGDSRMAPADRTTDQKYDTTTDKNDQQQQHQEHDRQQQQQQNDQDLLPPQQKQDEFDYDERQGDQASAAAAAAAASVGVGVWVLSKQGTTQDRGLLA